MTPADDTKDLERFRWLAENYSYVMARDAHGGQYHMNDPTGMGDLRAAVDSAMATVIRPREKT